MFSGSEALKHENLFQTLAHERSGLSYYSSDVFTCRMENHDGFRPGAPSLFFLSHFYIFVLVLKIYQA